MYDAADLTASQESAVTHPVPPAFFGETVLWVRHWTDNLFSFAITRPPAFRFRSGEFVMIGLMLGPKPLVRAYSIASPAWSEELEFFSIKVQDGPLTSHLQKIQPGDQVVLGKKPTGTLVLDALKPGKRLYLLGTGTGLAPFLSVARDPDAYERFEQVVVSHTVRSSGDLAYRDLFEREIFEDPLIGEFAQGRLTYYPSTTRDAERAPGIHTGRITDQIESGAFLRNLGLGRDRFDPAEDRIMVCGSLAMTKDTAALLESHGLKEGSNAEPGEFVIERAFVG